MLRRLTTILLVSILVVGVLVMFYPTISNVYNSFRQSGIGEVYRGQVAEMENSEYVKLFEDAREYNEQLVKNLDCYNMIEKERKEYKAYLRVRDSDVIGFLEIPKVGIDLPLYLGADENVLQAGIGHLEGTSLPVGGETTHTALTGHTGLPSSKLLTDVSKVKEGDNFLIKVLDEVYTYEVDQIIVVNPDELDALKIEEGADLATIITCTPYGINTHRLLVRGFRVPTVATDDSSGERVALIKPTIELAMLLFFTPYLLFRHKKSKKRS